MRTEQETLKAFISCVASYLPENVLTNEQLAMEYPEWSVEKIYEKTGIRSRHIASANETCSSMAVNSAKNLFDKNNVLPEQIDYILLCTQSPDYLLPTTACIVQHELDIPTTAGALDFNLGCSGYVYGLSLAKALIESKQAKKVLLLTSELYSRYINHNDKSVRTLFGDAATATLIEGKLSQTEYIHGFQFGTDGKGARNLIVPHGGSKYPMSNDSRLETEDASGNKRSLSNLYMNGAEILTFSLKTVPKSVGKILESANLKQENIERVIFHQANKFMLDKLRIKTGFTEEQFLISYEDYGNTVSSSIPLGIEKAIKQGKLKNGDKVLVCGFGVGYSWAGCVVEW
ncbi:3-oxoacyl-[acyl-carrier-protein] synthase-3 [Aeromonas sp. BIGb0405]|uniref:3-oxoacyl-ACP synthase III family protein n=1 Tax=Aeromonas sp. BIGb0405 TaxID=2940592 RepID=UPI0021692B4A|nr:ketoacyl-ACP synthase III [Aeromonas sp. BIGb0405]MCS3455402.1 3-oxoacyl-[acyl-carrier-protein] synthase-3 [Aeromonas sp. BIGb0405]